MSFLTVQKFLPAKGRFKKRLLLALLLLSPAVAVTIWAFVAALSQPVHAETGINRQINYQGKISDGSGDSLNGNYNFHFELYDAPSGGTKLWEETWSSASAAGRVNVFNGVFSVSLGTTTPLASSIFNSDNLYLQISFDSDSNLTYDQVFAPRKRLSASPYAFNADNLDGYDATTTAAAGYIPVLDSNAGLTVGGVTTTGNTLVQGDLTVLGDTNFATVTVTNLTVNNIDLGVITTGTWQGNIIAPAYGGTGQDTSGWTGFAFINGGNWESTTSLASFESDPLWLAASSSYLTLIDASNTYLSLTNASNTYLSIADATSTYLTINNASNTYLTSSSLAAAETDPLFSAASSSFLTLAQWSVTTTDALAEGLANLYFTDARARAAISALGPLAYDSSTGIMSLALS